LIKNLVQPKAAFFNNEEEKQVLNTQLAKEKKVERKKQRKDNEVQA
jgi:hypothetical protein